MMENREYTGAEITALDKEYVMHTYGRQPVVLVKGAGCLVWDADGKEYLDLVAGIAVNGLGHCHPRVVEAVCEQVGTLIHTSNLYYTELQPRLARLLVELSGMTRAFFCNSGSEANEAALKLARKAAKKTGGDEKTQVVAAQFSFHGRTLGAITATGQPKYQKSFLPLVPGFTYVPFNDADALRAAVNDDTCAVIMEPIQGESGVHPADIEFLAAAREFCDKHKAALIFDEVQTGLGRTGKMFGFQHFGIVPDIMTLAKTLGGGIPIGACLAKNEWAEVFEPGDHAATFGGNPLASAAALATVTEIINGKWAENAAAVGAYFREKLAGLEGIKEVRGMGLMIAAVLEEPKARQMVSKALENSLLINATDDNTLRFVPPLILTDEMVNRAINIIASIM